MWLALTRYVLLRFVGAPRWKCWTLREPEPIYPDSILSHSGVKIAVRPGNDLSQSLLVLSLLL